MSRQKSGVIYILPNIFTASGIFAGVISIVNSINGEFVTASWLIMLALIFDGLDGRVARLTNTCSRFGVEFDSLADLVAFGVAPSILLYMYAGHDYGRIGIVATALFVIFGAIRLARFNVMTSQVEPSVFIGVPIPTAAVFISILILLFEKYDFLHRYLYVLLGLSMLISFLMVSNIRYPSFKKLNFTKRYALRLFVLLLCLALGIFVYPIEGFALIFVVYILYGLIRAVVNMNKRSINRKE
ncbi:CDP-diacylglycerol--serine O-phosphatidyltransferase [Sulfurimonas sp. HSL-1716]|uniref:CDP-diacylglycerol--serine O-phosphatidyltransferase n=1 Tax=Hydrocurvibacter sulfurireducens TaxID=3131937 RepID=UPI0031F804BC